ncbi:MAG: phage tail protein [Burkholderiaceae bacterium]
MEPFLAEIRLTSFPFAPRGWAFCNGQLLPINQNQALFAVIGTYYGGNGVSNFALPDLRGRIALHQSGALPIGTAAGAEAHTLTAAEMPSHAHPMHASAKPAASSSPAGAMLATGLRGGTPFYAPATALVPLAPPTVAPAGGGQPHENRPPFLTLNYIIALEGIFPSQN